MRYSHRQFLSLLALFGLLTLERGAAEEPGTDWISGMKYSATRLSELEKSIAFKSGEVLVQHRAFFRKDGGLESVVYTFSPDPFKLTVSRYDRGAAEPNQVELPSIDGLNPHAVQIFSSDRVYWFHDSRGWYLSEVLDPGWDDLSPDSLCREVSARFLRMVAPEWIFERVVRYREMYSKDLAELTENPGSAAPTERLGRAVEFLAGLEEVPIRLANFHAFPGLKFPHLGYSTLVTMDHDRGVTSRLESLDRDGNLVAIVTNEFKFSPNVPEVPDSLDSFEDLPELKMPEGVEPHDLSVIARGLEVDKSKTFGAMVVPEEHGLRVKGVVDGTLASELGILPEDLLLSVGDVALGGIGDPELARRLLLSGFEIGLERDGESIIVSKVKE